MNSSTAFSLRPFHLRSEDVLFCIDVDLESSAEMKIQGPDGQHFTRFDAIKQAILLFMHSKLVINPDHRFALSVLSQSASLLGKEFSNDLESARAALQTISADFTYTRADLTQLFRIAAHEAQKSQARSRILRVVLIYCRSSVPPVHQWPANVKNFTFDVIYLHDKPAPGNCPQKVYDALVDALEHVTEYEGYIFESGQGLARMLFRQMCILLSHPQLRTVQDNIDFPKSLIKKSSPIPGSPSMEDNPNTSVVGQ